MAITKNERPQAILNSTGEYERLKRHRRALWAGETRRLGREALGLRERRALEWLEKAYQEHNRDLIELTREPSYRSLWSEEKFQQLVRRVGWSIHT
jgi:hypothetical protein